MNRIYVYSSLFVFIFKKKEKTRQEVEENPYTSVWVLLLSISDRCSPAGLFTLHGGYPYRVTLSIFPIAHVIQRLILYIRK